jgi:hypothetical protein
MGEKRRNEERKKIFGSLPFAKRVKNSKKSNLHTCKGGVQIVFSFTVYTKGVQKVYKDEFVHQLQICSQQKGRECINHLHDES